MDLDTVSQCCGSFQNSPGRNGGDEVSETESVGWGEGALKWGMLYSWGSVIPRREMQGGGGGGSTAP